MNESVCREFKVKENYTKSKFSWNKFRRGDKKPFFIGFDAETFEKDGNLLCLCNSENSDMLTTYGENYTHFDFIDFVEYFEKLKRFDTDLFVAYNLKFDAEVILKSLGEEKLREFYLEGEKFQGEFEDIKLSYLPKKYLSIKRKGGRQLDFFDTLQFFLGAGENGKSDLDSVAKKYAGLQKKYDGIYQNKKFPDKIKLDEFKKIAEYCQIDSILVKRLMNTWVDAFYRNFNFYPDKYYSAGYISSQNLRNQLDYLCTFNDVPFDVQKIAWNCYFGGRFEIFKRGAMTDIHHYDIKSAYPYVMSIMPDFNKGYWVKLNLKDWMKVSSDFGFCEIEVDVKENKISPFMFRQINGLVICPNGKFKTWCTLKELKVASIWYDFKLISLNGFYFHPVETKNPFADLIKNMYKIRMKQTNTGQKYVYKVLLNSLYGKFAQSKPEPKGLFNPVMCATITGYTRAMLLEAIHRNKDDIVMLATDGVFSREKLKVGITIGEKLGNWEYEHHPKFNAIMSGVYAFNTDKDEKLKYHSRGFSTKIFNEKNESMTFDLDEMQLKFSEDEGYYFDIRNMRALNICQSIIQKKFTTKLISKMIFTDKKLQINGDKKRIWLNTLSNIKDYNESVCIEA